MRNSRLTWLVSGFFLLSYLPINRKSPTPGAGVSLSAPTSKGGYLLGTGVRSEPDAAVQLCLSLASNCSAGCGAALDLCSVQLSDIHHEDGAGAFWTGPIHSVTVLYFTNSMLPVFCH